jgi:2-dehydrotetronate isomerase
MPRFSANLGFLWQELSLCDGINAAAAAGFSGLECHWPYDVPTEAVNAATAGAGLPMLGLNTRLGSKDAGDFGLSAVAGREREARGYIDEAVGYAAAIKCANVHVMAGKSQGDDKANDTYINNLRYACNLAAEHDIGILIEPINHRDVPDYHLSRVEQAVSVVDAIGANNIKIMFDCYHIQIMQGDLTSRLRANLDYIGHVQIAAVPDRGEPDAGEVNFPGVLGALDDMGYTGFVGAEYKPRTTTDAGLDWLQNFA